MPTIASCLWFDTQAEEAAKFYVSVFDNAKILRTSYYGSEGVEIHGRPAGSVMTVEFELDGHRFTALNGGPIFKFTPAVSFDIRCKTQSEIDHYWDKLSEGGDARAQQCGWLQDKYGLSWQVVPEQMITWMLDPDPTKSARVFAAMMKMKKLDISVLQRAYSGS
jgi:predicted 3-demethylubiquinone-9 3-methyltransferase (glyoxalase superfamily)